MPPTDTTLPNVTPPTETTLPPVPAQPAPGRHRIRNGWALTKSAWNAVMLDKELVLLPGVGFLASLVVLVAYSLAAWKIADLAVPGFTLVGDHQSDVGPWGIVFAFGFYVLSMFIVNYFSGAVMYGVTERFRGGTPTLKSSLAGARRKFWPIMAYSAMMATVGMILQAIEERLPLGGRIAVIIFNGAWNLANVFALPVIVLSDHNVAPFDATKQSVGIIKQIWGESIIVDLGIGLIGLLAFLAYIGLVGVAGIAAVSLGLPDTAILPLGGGLLLVLVGMILVLSVLTSVAKAALYFYATSGTAPASFSAAQLGAAVGPKTARKMFG